MCASGLDADAFRRELRARLLHVLRFDAYCVNTADPITRTVVSSIGDGLTTADAARLFAIEKEGGDFNALRALAEGPVHAATISEATGGRPEASARMCEIFLPLGYRDELRAALLDKGACWGWLHLYRRSGHFSHDELEQIRALTPAIGAALRTATLNAAAKPADTPALRAITDLDEVEGSTTAHVLHDLHGGAAACAIRPSGERVALHRDGDRVLATRPGAADLAELLFAAAGLTSREKEVAHGLVRGATNEALAAKLEIGLYTLKDHVRAVLKKLAVKNRSELIVRVLT